MKLRFLFIITLLPALSGMAQIEDYTMPDGKVVKIDRSILPLNGDEPNSRQLIVVLKHVIAMIREIGLECVVEGVETQYQLDLLQEMNCDVAQGFFFFRPLPVEDFEKHLNVK